MRPYRVTVGAVGHILCRPVLGGCITNMFEFDLQQGQPKVGILLATQIVWQRFPLGRYDADN
jgi:hypothetical protein